MCVIDYIEEVSKVIEYDRMTLSASGLKDFYFQEICTIPYYQDYPARKKKTLSIKSFDARTKYPVIG